MELWIRSQSKLSLVEAKNLTIIEREEKWHIVKLNNSLDIEKQDATNLAKLIIQAVNASDKT